MTHWPEQQIDREAFLSRHWQREPALFRQAIPNFSPPVSADELAGLAMEPDVESRIVACSGQTWSVEHGPFDLTTLQQAGVWTLLVQAVDQHVPAVAKLRDLVRFIPDWRIDDIMVSYGNDGSSVGPHFDSYDVFLLQGEGCKRWRLGQHCDAQTALQPHPDLRLLSHFDTVAEYLLEPGDILYVPPGVAHWGIACGDSTTFSIGFRAPRIADMISRWVDRGLEQVDTTLYYADPGLVPALRPGEIRASDLERAKQQLHAAIAAVDDDDWFGELATEPRYDCTPDASELSAAVALLHSGIERVQANSAGKLAWRREGKKLIVYANGMSICCDSGFIDSLQRLCSQQSLSGAALAELLERPGATDLLTSLLEQGGIHVE